LSADFREDGDVSNRAVAVLWVVLMVLVIVALDVIFFRGRPWTRLAVNVWIVLIFAAIYYRFLKRP